jgi:hypothetical protein
MLVSTKMRKPSETSRSRLIAIFGLIDEPFNLGVFPNGQRGKSVVYNAVRLFAATPSEALKSQSYYFFSLRLAFWQLAQQSVRHLNFYRPHWEPPTVILKAVGAGVKHFSNNAEQQAIVR